MATATSKLSSRASDLLRCPACRGRFTTNADVFHCNACSVLYPTVHGVPILIDESTSIFAFADFTQHRDTTFVRRSATKERLKHLLPSLSATPGSAQRNALFCETLQQQSKSPLVLVVGAGDKAGGLTTLIEDHDVDLIASDVHLGPQTNVVADAHSLPLADESVDAVVVIAVLEHVLDPVKCVEEIHRVLVPGGLVLAETPFMQQVHMGAYDFTRWTPLGHRRLFRRFEQIAGGPNGGEGMVLAWAWHYFLRGFASGARGRAVARVLASLTAFWLPYFDRYLAGRPPTWDGAKGSYFIGRRSNETLSDRDLINLYHGLDRR